MGMRRERTCVRSRPSRRVLRRSREGYTLVEVMVAAMVVGIAVLGAISAILSSVGLTRVNRDTAVARQAAQRRLEELQAVPFAEIFAAFNDDPADDAGLSVPAPGSGFVVEGLRAVDGDPDGLCGRVSFPVDPAGPAGWLREDLVDLGLGTPMDLNLDGGQDAVNHAGDYQLLPVRVEVRWWSLSGERTTELVTVLVDR